MDFVHVEDIARANLLAATAPVTDAVFNVGSGVETSLNGLADLLLSIMRSPLADPSTPPPRKVNPVSRRLAVRGGRRAQLGFRARVALEDGLRALVSWWQDQQSAAR